MFIVESMVVGLIGGIFGTALGVLGAYVVVGFMGMPHVFPLGMIFVGVVVSIVVGLIAGVYPANKAARMNPVDALRHE